MRNFTFKGLFLTAVFMLLGCLSIQAADDDLITKQITIKLEEAGTLPDRIASSKKYKITNLKIVGEINGTDWKMIRVMAGSDYFGDSTEGNLSVLDLSEAKIVEGGDYYYYSSYYNDTYYTSNDKIGDYAFYNCSRLTSLNLPDGITEIGENAFAHCSGLTSLTLPVGITSIGEYAFIYCSGLTNLTIPAGITEIGGYTFEGCSGLTSLNLSAGITEIGSFAFSGCRGLTSLTLPDGITSIGDYAFSRCSGLTSLNLPAGITEIGYSVFHGCSGLTSLNLPASLTTIGGSAFYGCSGLTSLNLPASITTIDDYAFDGCSGLTSLNLPASLTTIGGSAFSGCNGLTSLTLSSNITKIGGYAFEKCSGLEEVIFCINDDLETYLTKGHPYIDVKCGINYYINDKEITSIVIPSSVTSLGDYAFQKCSSLRSIYVSWPTPISAGDAFYKVDKKNCTLYVPQGTETDYFLADVWGDFGNIVEYDATGIDKTTTSTDIKEVSRYSVNGQRLVGPTKGLNIVKYSDGSVKKVAVE